ncbi:MAG: DUF4326 domain-containing protein [Proteobacteria bacterium]|nr:DUF4326 domain-containing protein [Pseudomonadota bacterium]
MKSFGNPFEKRENCKHTQAERDRVCDLYEEYFQQEIQKKDSELRKSVISLYRQAKQGKNILLLCHCHPKRCHADTIKTFLEKQLTKERSSKPF